MDVYLNRIVYLPSQHFVNTLFPAANVIASIRNHLMDAVKDAIKEWKEGK